MPERFRLVNRRQNHSRSSDSPKFEVSREAFLQDSKISFFKILFILLKGMIVADCHTVKINTWPNRTMKSGTGRKLSGEHEAIQALIRQPDRSG